MAQNATDRLINERDGGTNDDRPLIREKSIQQKLQQNNEILIIFFCYRIFFIYEMQRVKCE